MNIPFSLFQCLLFHVRSFWRGIQLEIFQKEYRPPSQKDALERLE